LFWISHVVGQARSGHLGPKIRSISNTT